MGSLNIIIISISILCSSLLDVHSYGFQHARYRCLHIIHTYRPFTIIHNTGIKYGNNRILKYIYINIDRVLYPCSKHSSSACYLTNENNIQEDSYHNDDVSINSTSNVTGIYESTCTTIIQSQIPVVTNIPIVENNSYEDTSSSSSAAAHNDRSHDINNTPNPDINISRTNLTTIVIPTIKELMKLGFPILGIWLLQPILSLVDSSILGLSPSVTVSELASLGPGIGFIDSTLYMFQFLGIGKIVS